MITKSKKVVAMLIKKHSATCRAASASSNAGLAASSLPSAITFSLAMLSTIACALSLTF